MNCMVCWEADSDNIDDDMRYVIVRNPNTGATVRRGYMCATHRQYYRMNGYEVS